MYTQVINQILLTRIYQRALEYFIIQSLTHKIVVQFCRIPVIICGDTYMCDVREFRRRAPSGFAVSAARGTTFAGGRRFDAAVARSVADLPWWNVDAVRGGFRVLYTREYARDNT